MQESAAVYEIELRGVLSEAMLSAFPALTGRTAGRATILSGSLADQAALHGVLARIESLGLVLIAVRQIS